MDGILIIDKPAGLTSHDVVSRVRKILRTKRVGHTGTLDPFATGVLVLLVGRATRLAQFLDKDEKEYAAVVRFGFETDTGDMTGMRNAECGLPVDELSQRLEAVDWNTMFDKFRGAIQQIPPMYSAKKVAGKKLYEHARKGEAIERKAINVAISKLETDGKLTENSELGTWNLELRVACSAGTYVRTLAEDIGRAIGTGAHLVELRRTRAGRFDLSHGTTLDELKQHADPSAALLPKEIAVEHLPSITLDATRVEKTKSGLSTRVIDATFVDKQPIRMLNDSGELLAVGIYDEVEKSVRPKIVLV
ncbi:MAG: tRNA pseudouridine(55) synthase TruB [Pyrinomonadaceae bacterium]